MSRHTFECLTAFLEQRKLTLVLYILIQYVDVQVFQGTPGSHKPVASQDEPVAGQLPAQPVPVRAPPRWVVIAAAAATPICSDMPPQPLRISAL